MRKAITLDHELFLCVATTLKTFGQWICEDFMRLHVLSHSCYHPDGLVKSIAEVDDVSGHIVVIQKLLPKEPEADLNEGGGFGC